MATRYDNQLLWNLVYTVCNTKDDHVRSTILNIPIDEWMGETHQQIINQLSAMHADGMDIPRFKFLHQCRQLNDETRTAVRTVACDPHGEISLIDSRSLEQAVGNMHESYKWACAIDAMQEAQKWSSRADRCEKFKKVLNDLTITFNDVSKKDSIVTDRNGVDSEVWNNMADGTQNQSIQTGWTTFDEKCGGIPGAGLTFITAPTGNGKSHVAISLATKCSMEYQQQVAIVSIEMPAMEYFERHIKNVTGIPMDLGFYAMNKESKKSVFRAHAQATSKMGNGKLSIFTPQQTSNIIAVLEQAKSFGASIIIIDYLQLFYDDNSKSNRTEYLKKLTTLAHNWGIKHNTAVVMLSQLNADGKMAWVTGASTDAACWLTFEVSQENRDAGQTEIQVAKYRGRTDNWSFWVDLDYRRSRIWESKSQRGIGSNYTSELKA